MDPPDLGMNASIRSKSGKNLGGAPAENAGGPTTSFFTRGVRTTHHPDCGCVNHATMWTVGVCASTAPNKS